MSYILMQNTETGFLDYVGKDGTVVEAPAMRAWLQGHAVEKDPPASGMAERWTCTRCGRAVLRASTGNIYGSAADQQCEGEEE